MTSPTLGGLKDECTLRFLTPAEQAMADRLLAYLQDDHMQMPDDEFLKLGLGLSSEFISKLTADLAAKIDARKGNGAGHE